MPKFPLSRRPRPRAGNDAPPTIAPASLSATEAREWYAKNDPHIAPRSDAAMRRDGERMRLRESLSRLRAILDSFERTLAMDVPITEGASVLAEASVRMVGLAARFDAFDSLVHEERRRG